LALLAALAAPFSVSDTTDNDTGQRTVWALQIDQDLDRLSFLHLKCIDRKPTVELELYGFNAPDWAVVTLGGGDAADTPFIFERVPDRRDELRFHGDARILVNQLQEDSIRQFTVHSPLGNRSASFDMDGLTRAWQRVVAAC